MSKEQYGISRHEMKLVEQAAKRREALRNEYLKLRTNPHRHATGEGGFVFDPAIQRFASMRMTRYDHFRPTPKTSLYGLALTVIPFLAITYFIKGKRDEQEHKYRTGQVAYKDRSFKFQ